MGFFDYPFKEGGESFITHAQVLQYLEDYAQHFQLKDYIQVSKKIITFLKLIHPRLLFFFNHFG